ncbi:MAG: sulfotransferase family protein [Chloroflexota bacterium]
MKVIGAGLGRTGTLSLKVALEELGFDPCYHMQEAVKKPRHFKTWYAAKQGDPVDWKQFLHDYQATVDWPGCTFYQELMEVYPDAKVLLSVRDSGRWYDSTYKTIYQARTAFAPWLRWVIPPLRWYYQTVEALVWQGMFEGEFDNRQKAIETVEQFNEAVKQHVPPERLLIYEVKQGWEPLCEFLDVPVPNTPFPHVNESKEMIRAIGWARVISKVLSIGAIVVILAGLIWLIW